MAAIKLRSSRLPPEVNRILYVKNLPFKITSEEMYDIFGKYGAIRQIRVGATAETKGTAFVVFEDIYDAKNACEHLQGFNVGGRFLVVIYFQPTKQGSRFSIDQQKAEVEALKARVAAGEAASKASAADDSVDDETDRKFMKR